MGKRLSTRYNPTAEVSLTIPLNYLRLAACPVQGQLNYILSPAVQRGKQLLLFQDMVGNLDGSSGILLSR